MIVGDWIIPEHVVSIRVILRCIISVLICMWKQSTEATRIIVLRIIVIEGGGYLRNVFQGKKIQQVQVVASLSASTDCIV